ncbi:MAG: hypothetical protein ACTS2F_13630 [Thainema sp.]
MIVDRVLNDVSPHSFNRQRLMGRSSREAQEAIYAFLLDAVKHYPAEAVLEEFKRLFIQHVDTVSSNTLPALYEIVFANDAKEFRNTLKRSCYILINNWETSRQHKAIQDLVLLFQDPLIHRRTVSPTLKRLRSWLFDFVHSKDYEDLKLFAARYLPPQEREKHWTSRYTAYLLTSQFADADNPTEQREAARLAAQQLKDRFKLDLALYTAKSQAARSISEMPNNPTGLGEGVLRLIKTIVMRRGTFSYANLANIFVRQIQGSRYENFKKSLLRYILFALPDENAALAIRHHLGHKLDELYLDHHDAEINNALLLRTCNRVIEYLTTEDRESPSPLFCMLLANGNSLPIVSVLLKLILICRNSRTHLETRIADLIHYYKDESEEDCRWVINFFEVFNVTFTIYTENVEYSLVRTSAIASISANPIEPSSLSLDAYRIFSQIRHQSISFGNMSEEEAAIADEILERSSDIDFLEEE